jgi:ketosteroid isomerase-like protein
VVVGVATARRQVPGARNVILVNGGFFCNSEAAVFTRGDACARPEQGVSDMSDAENLKIVSAVYEAFGAGDLEGVVKNYAPDCMTRDAISLPYGGVYTGPQEALAKVRKMMEVWKDIDVRLDTMTSGGGYVIAYGSWTATGTKTNLRVTVPLLEVWRLEGGKVVFVEPVYADTFLVNKALGHEPQPTDYEGLLTKVST